MSLLIQQDRDAAALRRGTRLFLLAGLLAVLAIIAAILVRQGLFRQTTTLGFVADTAQDINKGMAVKVVGFRVGSVEDITLRPDGKVEVGMEIDSNYMRFVTQDAVAELRKEGLVGSATIEIVPGPDRNRLASADAVLAFSRAEGLTGMAQQLRAEVVPILRDIKSITGTLADAQHGIPATLNQVNATTGSLRTLLDTGNRQAGEVGGAATRAIGKAEADLSHLGDTLQTVNAQLPAMLGKTQRVLDHVEKISAEAETSLPPALKDGSATVGEVREIVSGAKQAWPLRNLVEQPGPATLKVDSDPHAQGGRGATR